MLRTSLRSRKSTNCIFLATVAILALKSFQPTPISKECVISHIPLKIDTSRLEGADVRLLTSCRRLVHAHAVASEDSGIFHSWVSGANNLVSQTPQAPRPSIDVRIDVAFNFSLGQLFNFQSWSDDDRCDHVLRGPVVVHRDWWMSAHAHFIYEHLPVIAWLRAMLTEIFDFNATSNEVLLLDDIAVNREFMEFFHTDFAKKILWVQRDATVCVKGAVFVPVYTEDSITGARNSNEEFKTAYWIPESLEGRPRSQPRSFGHPYFLELTRSWIRERSPHITAPIEKPIALYYVRGRAANNGRKMDEQNEELLIQSLKKRLRLCGRTEEVVLFDGRTKDGKQMSQKDQFMLFRSASLFIGPHGGAFAMILFMPHTVGTNPCPSRPQVFEYIAGPRSAHVQWAFASYYSLYFAPTWVEYHVVQFTQKSTAQRTFVNMTEWEQAADAIFRAHRCPLH